MNFPGNYFHIGDLETEELRALVAGLSEDEWNRFPAARRRVEAHPQTQLIGLAYDPDFRHSHPTRLPLLAEFEEALKPALWMTSDHFEDTASARRLTAEHGRGYFIRAALVRLPAGSQIASHRDMNFSLAHSHRVHLPIVTNDEVWFTVGNETFHMGEGQLTEINNRRVHSVVNGGDTDRVHLVLDFVLPGEPCCCGPRLHPKTRCSPQACEDAVEFRVPCDCYPE